MDKKVILAIALSMVVWVGWYLVFKPAQPVVDKHKTPITEKTQDEKKESAPAVKDSGPQKQTSGKLVIHNSRVKEEKKIHHATDLYKIRFSNKGASIDSFIYKYKGRDIELIVNRDTITKYNFQAKGSFNFNPYFSEEEFQNGSQLDEALWDHEIKDNQITFFTTIELTKGNPLRIEKRFVFQKDKPFFQLDYKFINMGKADVQIPSNHIILSPSDFLGPDVDFNNSYNHLSSVYFLDGDFDKGSKGGGLFSKSTDITKKPGSAQWAGIMSRYFLLILVPDKFTGSEIIFDSKNHSGFRCGIVIPSKAIKSKEELTKTVKIYAGEKDKEKLLLVEKTLIPAADISRWIEPIRDFLIWSLLKINLLLGNFGWSLVLFSLITKIVLLPLTMKSTESMKKLQALNPKISEIREKYKDKPEIMNKKIMELYKKEKVNPASGCLPLLLQMPFFFALYSALNNSIDLWHAPFILWMKDLSMPDTVLTISDFNINILPILMTATTFLQQKMTPGADSSSQQQMFMKLMPLIFIVIFWNMPSGLIIYWIMQNILQILHQPYINKRAKTGEPAQG